VDHSISPCNHGENERNKRTISGNFESEEEGIRIYFKVSSFYRANPTLQAEINSVVWRIRSPLFPDDEKSSMTESFG
jgi:hypothetical protein